MSEVIGKEIRGYRILDEVGKGAFGAVYRAQQNIIGREVAIKIILPEYANRPDFIRSFEAEAQLVARLEHIHIVPLFDYWRDPDGAYLVMRLLPDSLRDEIARSEGGLEPERVAQVLEQISAALMVAHRNGVVHRDMKPANILLDPDGNAYLADFGIAKVLTTEGENAEEGVSGTPAYISPEQVMGANLSPQSDIYSLGIVVFEMLTGQKPFQADNAAELLVAQLQKPLPSLLEFNPNLSEELDSVVQRATAKEPIDRYADTMFFAREFRKAISGGELHISEEVLLDTLQILDVANPYKGLRSFQEADAADFFGREELIQRLMDRLDENHPMSRFLAIVGASGSGKSSVVKAGVLPALRQGKLRGSEHWYIIEMVPNIHPLRELESALLAISGDVNFNLGEMLASGEFGLMNAVNRLLPQGTELVLVIDQFEEAFTMVSDEDERTRFLEMVRLAAVHPSSQLHVLVTLRADFMDQPLQNPGFGELMRQRTEFVLPMNPEEIERAIEGPAERVGLTVEPELLAAIVTDVRGEPGALPLLQYAMTEVFEERLGITLTLGAYQKIGGAPGALARRAEQLYQTLEEKTQLSVRQLFLRLVTLGEGKQDTRRRVGWTELAMIAENSPEIMAVRDLYVKYRLLTTDRDPQTREPTLEIAHEALIRRWQRLLDWLNASREDIRTQRRLSGDALRWREAGRDKSFLLSGANLEQIAAWSGQTDVLLTEEERAYIAASLVQKRTQESREKARQLQRIETERRIRNRLQVLVGVMVVVVGIALGLTLFGFFQANRWEQAAGRIQANADEMQLTLQSVNNDYLELQMTATALPTPAGQ